MGVDPGFESHPETSYSNSGFLEISNLVHADVGPLLKTNRAHFVSRVRFISFLESGLPTASLNERKRISQQAYHLLMLHNQYKLK